MEARKFDFQDSVCSYCEFEGIVIIFENDDGEQVHICAACVETCLEEFNEAGLAIRN